MTGPQDRTKELRRKAEFHRRVTTANEGAMRSCCIFGCGRPTQAAAGRGLSLMHCRYHVQARNRHGSFWKKTYLASDLLPYRRAAEKYLKANRENFWIAAALVSLRGLLAGSGPVDRIVDVLHMSPHLKARAALARMRRAEIPPERLLAIHLAVSAAVRDDPIRPGDIRDEYRLTQIGKAVARLASGQRVSYGSGSRYPRSSGLALRHLGRMIEASCEHVMEEHLEAILASKTALFGSRKGSVYAANL